MRNGSASLVPLFIAIVLIFWSIMFLGDSSDTLKAVSDGTRTNRIQSKMIIPAGIKAFELEQEGVLTDAEIDAAVDKYVSDMMDKNAQTNLEKEKR